ncbi:hypothetical protein BP6252_09625 [Coleophoma cylindrospora]|uniref:Uncharacterized protein n=1 Tax=Coleophoma cylindrospora TaxID=1849047 RepID=A0A3D8QWD0_9HELO|nr:hypothetical protein BP6252_09625 [Coleophoma cylindrospora]
MSTSSPQYGPDAKGALALAVALIVIWTSLINIRQSGFFYHPESSEEQYEVPESVFLREAMNVEFPAPIDYKSIQDVCTRNPSNFQPGLLFSCEEQHGGIGMIRNEILKCIRYAIHGGGALVIPSMSKRNPKDITDIETTVEVPLEYLFERETFIEHLTKGCPGMLLYDRAEDFPNYAQRQREPINLLGGQFEGEYPRTGLRYPRQWRGFFDSWLNEQQIRLNPDTPVHIKIEQSFLEYPVHDDGDAFSRDFGKILSFRKDTKALAAKVLFEMKRQFALPIDPTEAVNPNAFYGAHLRLEKDAVEAWDPEEWRYSRMEDQFQQQFQNLVRTGLSVVYVASGNRTVVDLFAAYLSRRLAEDSSSGLAKDGVRSGNVTVVTKYDLLQGDDRRQLDKMTFDQQGLVDFLIMFKASAFMGVAHSSFPWTVALRRHELSRYANYANLGSDLLKDEYSTIMGMRADYPYVDPFEYGIWP